jgi:hypothetical protein
MEEPRSLLADFVRTWDRNFPRADQLATSHKSPLILQPGPAALTDGLAELQNIIQGWACVMGRTSP